MSNDDGVTLVAGLFVVLAVLWIYIFLPAKMAINRRRSAVGWVFVSLVSSPIIAIIALLVLGIPYRPDP